MRTIIKHITIVLGLVLILSSCQDFLIREPVLSQTSELTLSTVDGLNNATVGAYSLLYSLNWYGGYYVLSSEMRGGNGKPEPQNAGYQVDSYYWNYTESNTENLWNTAYATIARGNNVINAVENFDGTPDEMEELQHYKAECLFLRALAHFDLVRLYAQPYSYDKTMLGVPVILVTEMGEPARNTVEEVYNQVVADLLEAEQLFGTYARTDGNDVTAWATKDATRALLARVYQNMENWQAAADYATKVIESNNYEMWTADQYVPVSENPDGAWGREAEGSEVIFSVYSSTGNSSYPGQEGIPYMTNEDAHGDVTASNDLLNLFEDGDVRRNLFKTSDKETNAGFEWTLKYPSKSGDFTTNNTPVIRLSELYLIRTEAIYNGASVSGVSDLDDFNMVHTNRGLSARTQALTLTDISTERRKELCFEGQIFFDLSRRGESLVRTDFVGTTNQNVAFPGNEWAVPIPVGEVNANPNMEQNP
ncbi:MAG: RagB/SusD family nutrient uptake outer membrane protein [Prolixibacteraceae bacterium]